MLCLSCPRQEAIARNQDVSHLDIIHSTSRLLATRLVAASRAQLVFRLGLLSGLINCLLTGILGDVLCEWLTMGQKTYTS